MKKVVFASVLAVATGTAFYLPVALAQGAQSSQDLTIKDPAEYNAYTNATGQSSPAAQAAAIEQFLTQYPNSVVKTDMLGRLMRAYQQTGDATKTLDAAKRLLAVDPNNLTALLAAVYIEKQQASKDPSQSQVLLDDAAAKAQTGLNAPKPASLPDADYQKLKAATTPIFNDAIAADFIAKKDFKSSITYYTAELKAYDPAQTTQPGPGLLATYNLGNAYVQQDPKDLVNGVWFLTRASLFLQPPYKDQVTQQAEYWYKKYHCAQNDQNCITKLDGYDQVKALAQTNLFPPDSYKPTPAPPPPSPQELAHQAVVGTPDLKTLALGDKEFILANGNTEDAGKVWDVLKGVTAEIPGTVIAATADSVQIAVSDDAKQSQKADFTVNMKAPLKEVPQPNSQIKLVGTFDSYTQNPAMIIVKDGELPAAEKKTPAHRAPVRRKAQ